MKNGWYEETLLLVKVLTHYVNDKISNTKNISQIWEDGEKYWDKNNIAHRLDGPAREYSDGSKSWYYEGKKINCQSQEEFERYLKLKSLW